MIQPTPMDCDQVKAKSTTLRRRYEGTGKLHDKIRFRRLHYHNRPEVDPLLPDIWAHAVEQTTLLEDTHLDMKSRLLENRWMAQCTPAKETAAGKSQAEKGEEALVFLFDTYQKRTGIDIQADLIDCMGIDGPGYLHWRVDGYGYEDPDYEEIDELPEDTSYATAQRYTKSEYGKAAERAKGKRYRETDDSLQERRMRARAESGGPVFLEVLTGEKVYVEQDKSQVSEFKSVLVVREIGLGAAYEETDGWTAKDWWEHASGDDAERDSPVGNEQGTKLMDTPSASDWGETCTLEQLWTRDWCYETLRGATVTDGELFRAVRHHYGAPPFSKVVGNPIRSDDPALGETSYLESMYRRKPAYDRTLSLRNALAESGAVPVYFLQETATGKFGAQLRDATGTPLTIEEDSAKANTIPSGNTIVRYGGEGVAGSYEKMVEQQKQEMLDARPSTGRADFGVSTKPFAALQQSRQENRQPKMLLDRVRLCLEPMVNSVMKCLADKEHGPGPIAFFPIANGDADTSKVQVMQPDEWAGLVGGVNINPVDSTEKIAQMTHGLELLHDPILGMSRSYFVEKFLDEPNPEQLLTSWDVEKYVDEKMKPGIIMAKAAEWAGPKYVLTADGGFANYAGQAQGITQVAQGMGATPIRQPMPPAPGMGGSPIEQSNPQMSPMQGDLTTPPTQGIA